MYWWLKFLPQWSSSYCILQTQWTSSPAMDLYTNAFGLHGYLWSGRWIQAQCPAEHINNDITWKELYATHGGTSGNVRKYFSIVIVGEYVRYGKTHPPNILRSWP